MKELPTNALHSSGKMADTRDGLMRWDTRSFSMEKQASPVSPATISGLLLVSEMLH